jgi:A/G-specific adenine glycosylase
MKPKAFQKALLTWHRSQGRHTLPWRSDYDAYKVWLAEIMLQQTTVATVGPYYLKFLAKYPSVQDLAAAHEDEVLALWQGLGYYSRARNLRKCAQAVVRDHKGIFPSSEEELLALPGIGGYTAAAIRSIAYNKPAAVVDGNVERIIARLKCLPYPPKEKPAEVKKLAQVMADGVSSPRAYSEALMDFGATICTPKSPKCLLCPVQDFCGAFKAGDVEKYPLKLVKKKRPALTGQVYVVQDKDSRYYLQKRPEKGLLAGLYEFPNCGWQKNELPDWLDTSEAEYKGVVNHIFTHLDLTLEVYSLKLNVKKQDWLAEAELKHYALPTLMKKVLRTTS